MSLGTALQNGHSPSQILQFLKNNFPQLSGPIAKAVATGYSVEKILSFLSQYMKKEDTKGLTPNEIDALRSQQYSKNVKRTAAALAQPFISSFANPAIQAISGASQQPPPGPTPMGGAPISPTFPSPSPLIAGSQAATQTQQLPPQAPNIPSPKASPSLSPVNSVQIINDMGIGAQIKSLQQAGNSPEAISAAIGVSLKPGQRKWLDEQIKAGNAKPLADMVADYISEPGQRIDAKQTLDQVTPEAKEFIKGQMEAGEEGTLPEMLDKFGKQKKESPLMKEIGQDVTNMEKKIEKGSLVGTSDGMVGEVKEIRNGKALVEDDGKLHQISEKDLELPDDEVIEAVERILNLPEIEKSAIISSLIYRPSQKQMFVKYHNGESYVYEDVDQEEVAPIAEAMGIPVTTGQNIYGAWEQGKQDSRGAALIHGILKQAKYAKDQEGKTWEKLETKYDRHKKLFKKPKRKRKTT